MDAEHKAAMRAGRSAAARAVVAHTVRTADGGRKTFKRYGRKLAMNALCKECMGYGDPSECTSPLCPLYPYRRNTQATLRGDEQ